MKKILSIIIALLVLVLLFANQEDYYVIPNESIRLRIIANSNSVYDQYIKIKVKEQLEKELSNDLKNSSTIDNSRKLINNNINNYKEIINDTLDELNYDMDYEINYGQNYFPKKTYKGVIYEEGYYESLLVTLGSGEGDNWWCVLFPPICTLEVEENEEIEYKFYIQEVFEKYFPKNK